MRVIGDYQFHNRKDGQARTKPDRSTGGETDRHMDVQAHKQKADRLVDNRQTG